MEGEEAHEERAYAQLKMPAPAISLAHPAPASCNRGARREWRNAMKSAYGRQTPAPDYALTCVEPGSPVGETTRAPFLRQRDARISEVTHSSAAEMLSVIQSSAASARCRPGPFSRSRCLAAGLVG